MQTTRRGLLACGAALGVGMAGGATAQTPVRAVIELFTSQGCSSCPPADRLLGELAHDPGLVVLSLPVDYWDQLGWKDSFAQPGFTSRQRAYARLRGDGEIYTPQAVVNGGAIAVGSDRAGILSLARGGLPVRVSIDATSGDATSGDATSGDATSGDATAGPLAVVEGAPDDAVLILAPFLRARTVSIGRGENARATVTYTNIVRRLVVLGPLAGAARLRLPDVSGDADGFAVLVQRGGLDAPGHILGAARI